MVSNNSALKIAHKIELWAHIKRLGRLWGEEENFLVEYGKNVYNIYKDELEVAINCFKELADQGEILSKAIKRI